MVSPALQILMVVWPALGCPWARSSLAGFAGKPVWAVVQDFLSEHQGSHSDQHCVWT